MFRFFEKLFESKSLPYSQLDLILFYDFEGRSEANFALGDSFGELQVPLPFSELLAERVEVYVSVY
jgi:hypothetical protein